MLPTLTLSEAATLLRQGAVVGMPTETVYGLAADATHDRAVAEIFARKDRPRFNPLIIHGEHADVLKAEVEWNAHAQALAEAFWPGPLTLVLPRRSDARISLLASAGLSTLAVRVPGHPLARALIAETGRPLAAPSANRSGRLSPTSAPHVREEFGEDFPVLDGGASTVGLESTVVDICGAPTVLRLGAISARMLSQALGQEVRMVEAGSDIRSPGQLLKHYAPRASLRLNAMRVGPDEALLAFGPAPLAGARHTLNLSATGDVVEAAANLFAHLRAIDATGVASIAVMPVPGEGVGAAINDRLTRGVD